MKREVLYLSCFVIISFFIFNNCTSLPDNTAVSSDGVKIVFDNKGEGEPALIFVHGWSNNKSIWKEQLPIFSKKYKTIAVDLAGFGESGSNRNNWTIENFGNDVTAIINKLNLNEVVLIGFSMGVPVVIEAAKNSPDKIIGLVIVDAYQNIEMKIPDEMIGKIVSSLMDVVTNPTKEKMIKGGFIKKNPDKGYELILSMLKNTSKEGWSESAKSTLLWHNKNNPTVFSDIKIPIIAINSDRKPLNTEVFKKYIPSFEAYIIPNTGHIVFYEEPEKFNSLLEDAIQKFVKK